MQATTGAAISLHLFCRILALLLAVASTGFLSNQATAESVTLIEQSRAVAKIYVHPDEMKPVERVRHYRMTERPSEISVAIADLNYHLEQMSGGTLEVVEEHDPARVPSPALVIGKLAEQLGAAVEASDWQEGYRIVTKDGRLLVAGERDVASSYAVYALLYELGCDWVMPGKLGEVIPEQATVSVGAVDQAVQPDFALRHIWIGGGPKHFLPEKRAEFDTWTHRQRFGSAEALAARRNESHMWQAVVRKYQAEFEDNPEMLAMVRNPDGTYERRGPQLETTNPDTVQLVARYFRELFEERGWPKDKPITLPVGPADGLDYSESPESRAAGTDRRHPIHGAKDHTDLVVKFANDVLEEIGDEFPNLTLGFYVYSTHNEFPLRYELNPRIRPIFAPISYSRFHSTIDPHSKTRAYYRQIVDQYAEWAEASNVPLMVYEYNWNLADNLLPYTRIRSVAEDLQFYHERDFVAFTMQAMKVWSTAAPNNYIYARMLWDVSLDWRDLLTEFCEKAYGPAASQLEQYFLRLADQQREAGYEAGSYFSTSLIFDEEFMSASRADLETAIAHPDLDDKQRKRIQAVMFAFRTLELYLAWEEASNAFNFAKAAEIGEDLRTNYEAALELSYHLYDRAGGIYIDRLLLNSTQSQLKYSSEPYEVLYELPDALPTMFDPTSNGENLNLYGTQINDSDWIKTKTFSSTWDAQGLGLLRQGSVWYRTRFDVPENLENQGVGLLLGAFEDEARVWVNGEYVGSTGIIYPQAAAVDLTDAIRFGEENLMAIEIRRNSKANELLLGGILRASFVFVGPRVETPEPPSERIRVLPGGEREIIKENQ